MSRYRKRPVIIDAVRWDPPFKTFPVPEWVGEAINKNPQEVGSLFRYGDDIHIHTLEGKMTARPGDYIIRGVKGELYPCKPDIFEATYELVVEDVK